MRRSAVVALMAGMLALTGCGAESRSDNSVPPPSEGGKALRYIAVGASESVGNGSDEPLRQAWPKVLWADAMPRRTTFVDLAVSGSTTKQALEQQLDEAVKQEPDVVTVWLAVNDMTAGVSTSDYERQLTTLVSGLRRDGKTQVLVGNAPPLDELPSYLELAKRGTVPSSGPFAGRTVPSKAEVVRQVDSYNAAIARVTENTGATLVDLHANSEEDRKNGTFAETVAGDGFHPSTKGHAEIAKVFGEMLKPLD